MDKHAHTIAVAIHCAIFVAIMYDIALWYCYGIERTITHVVRAWCKETPALPFIMGFLACHLMGA